jgi:phosphoenolpyruvate carboxylase
MLNIVWIKVVNSWYFRIKYTDRENKQNNKNKEMSKKKTKYMEYIRLDENNRTSIHMIDLWFHFVFN